MQSPDWIIWELSKIYNFEILQQFDAAVTLQCGQCHSKGYECMNLQKCYQLTKSDIYHI